MNTSARAGAGDDEIHMARALQLARFGLYTTDPNPRVGCVLIKDGCLIGEGWHARAGEAHAEVHALRAAGAAAFGATAYVTLEPCSHFGRTPPCADALIAAGVARVCCATTDPAPYVAGAGLARLRAAGIAVSCGLMAREARELNVGFFSHWERQRPFVRLKLAMSLDGRTAPAGGGREWISSAQSRADVQHWRARSSAIVTGAGTVRVDDPGLNVRLNYGPWIRQPLRVVLDPLLSCQPTAAVFAAGGALALAAESAPQRRAAAFAAAGVAVERIAMTPRGLDLHAVLAVLAARQAREVLVECGARLAGAFLRERLVDELIVYLAPRLMGADAAPLTALLSADLKDAGISGENSMNAFDVAQVEPIGADVRLTLIPKKG